MVDTIVDRFDRADDATGLGSLVTVELGNLQVVDETARQVSGGLFAETARAVFDSALDVRQQRAAIFAEITGTTGSPFAEVFARFKEKPNISPADTNTGYAVRLTRPAAAGAAPTLSIQKYDSNVATSVGSANLTVGSPEDRLLAIQIGVQDVGNAVEITAFAEDLENPILTFVDKKAPIWQQIGQVGFHTFEGTSQTSPQVLIHAFEAAVLDVEADDGFADEPLQWDATKIVNHIRLIADRNSSISELNFNDVLDFLNLTESQFINDVGPVEWRERIFDVTAQAGTRFVRLPRRCSDEIIDIYDDTHNTMLAHRNRHDVNNRFRNREGSSGQPELWVKVGRTAGDRVQIELFPIPSGVVTLRVWARAIPGDMDANDYPLVPQEFVDALVQGTIVKAGMASGNERLLRIASATYQRWVNRARAKDRRSRDIQIVPARSLPQRLRPPQSRFEQRRFPFL